MHELGLRMAFRKRLKFQFIKMESSFYYMRKLYFSNFILLTFLSIEVFSQTPEFAPVGAKWYFSSEDPYYDYYSYVSYESVGDTIILEKNCNIVETTSESTFYDSIRVFLHTTGDRVQA